MDLIQERTIRRLCREVENLDGDAAEVGVYQGESAELITGLLCERSKVYLFDTFDGHPGDMITPLDKHLAGQFRELNLFQRVSERLNRYAEFVRYFPGVFPKTLAQWQPCPLKFVHIDCDLYRSTEAALKWAWGHLIDGGVILDDDYDCDSTPGAKAAVLRFLEENWDADVEYQNRFAIIRRRTV